MLGLVRCCACVSFGDSFLIFWVLWFCTHSVSPGHCLPESFSCRVCVSQGSEAYDIAWLKRSLGDIPLDRSSVLDVEERIKQLCMDRASCLFVSSQRTPPATAGSVVRKSCL